MPPPRTISLLPSATELLCAIGGAPLLVGRSHECDFPDSVQRVPALTSQRTAAGSSGAIDAQVREALRGEQPVASLYELDVERLVALAPQVILTQDLCDVCSIDLGAVRAAAVGIDPPPRIVSLDPASIEDVFEDALRVGEAVGLVEQATELVVVLRERYWSAIDHVNPYIDGPEIAFLEWMDPLLVGGHWTPQLIEAAGARHGLNRPGAPSRRIEPDELVAAQPQKIIICPCGYDVPMIEREMHVLRDAPWWNELPAVRSDAVALIDGKAWFNRPGPRMVDAFEWLVRWVNG